jgi:hypothetical protein
MSEIVRLKITLDNVEPEVLRCIEVPTDIKLDGLHLVIQIAMGWENYHLYEFRAGTRVRGRRWGILDPGWKDPDLASAKQATLSDLLPHAGSKKFQYVYDFGDDWQHTVEAEAVVPKQPDTLYPRLVEARSACPPEDVGGPWGYAHYLEAIADPQHGSHKDMIEWRGPDFNPASVDEAAIGKQLEALSRPRAARKARSSSKRAV